MCQEIRWAEPWACLLPWAASPESQRRSLQALSCSCAMSQLQASLLAFCSPLWQPLHIATFKKNHFVLLLPSPPLLLPLQLHQLFENKNNHNNKPITCCSYVCGFFFFFESARSLHQHNIIFKKKKLCLIIKQTQF